MAQAVIGALRVNLGLDSAQFEDGLKKSGTRLKSFEQALTRSAQVVGALGVAAAAAGAAVTVSLTKASMETIDAQSKMAARVGASVKAIQTLEQAAGLAGVSNEAMVKSIEKLNEKLGEAERKAAGPTAEAIARLGLSLEELTKADADERLGKIADRMVELGYTTQQQADTLRQFGIRNQEVVNLLQGGSAALQAARKDVEDFGIAVSDIDAAKIEAANDAMSRIGLATKGIGNQLAVELAPLIQGIAELFTDAARGGVNFGEITSEAVSWVVRAIGFLADEVRKTEIFFQELNVAGYRLTATFAEVIAAVTGTSDAADRAKQATGALNRALADLHDLNTQDMPSDAIDAWVADVRKRADEAAQAVMDARAKMTGDATFAGSDAKDDPRAEAERQRLASQLEMLKFSLASEEEAENMSYEQRLKDLATFRETEMLTQAAYDDLEARAKQEHEDRLTEITQRAIDMELRARADMINRVSGLMGELGSALQAAGEKNFNVVKGISIAQAVLKGYEAVVSSYAAGSAIGGPPVGLAYAAIAAATTAAQIAQIAATQPSSRGTSGFSGGGGGAGRAAGAAASTAGAEGRSIYIEGLDASHLYSGDAVRTLVDKLIEFQADGGKLVLA
ncbi:MAG: hypothetical protein H6883_07260 [Rhodobiaceae bacterium]|nr:hypothetical protein [Rhodobiaceae bacterium]MCC0055918.1 hypothetical protein [Rhodobiaceae bacterium]